MNTSFSISQWLKQQTPISPPDNDFEAIYQQVKPEKPAYRGLKAWAIAAGIALMAVGLLWINQPTLTTENVENEFLLSQLQQKIKRLEHNLDNHQSIIAGDPGSTQLENRVLLEQWLDHLNNRLSEPNNAQQHQGLLKAKLTVLQNLNQKKPTIQLI